MSAKKPIIFSGIQPSGDLTIGTYLGAIKNWVEIQKDHECLFSLVDLHAITIRQNPALLNSRCYDCLALYLACGIDPNNSLIFCQSHIPQHTQLAWILNCFTYMGELNRMTQFKDKAQKYAANINAGLFAYPVLMAADILLYDVKVVPVGADQKQHVELTRDVAIRFNNLYGDIFTIPEFHTPKVGTRIMGLQDPTKKMSKSNADKTDIIYMLDSPDDIANKLKRAVTDSGKEIKFDAENKPGIANLLTIVSATTGKTIAQLENEYSGQGYGKFKTDVADIIISCLKPIQKRHQELIADKSRLDSILKRDAEKARDKAQKVLSKVHEAIGFIT
jgi:tryptophanyl-tRNA synthetase